MVSFFVRLCSLDLYESEKGSMNTSQHRNARRYYMGMGMLILATT